MYKADCDGCKLSQGYGKPLGGIIVELDGDWILSHYGGSEGFLGWMALQPKFHRMELAELTPEEARTLGKNIQRVDMALRHYWSICFQSDPIRRVYVVYFFESPFDESKGSQYHLHIHLIPRTEKVGARASRKGKPSQSAAWNTPKLTCKDWFPQEYRIRDKTGKEEVNKEEVVALMTCLKLHLEKCQHK